MEDRSYYQDQAINNKLNDLLKIHEIYENKFEVMESKISHLNLTLKQRNEDIFAEMEKFVQLKNHRDQINQLRQFFESKSRNSDDQLQQFQSLVSKQLQTLKEEVGLQFDNQNQIMQKLQQELNQKLQSFQKLIQTETIQEIATFVAKAGQMEESMIEMFDKKGKVIEKITLMQDNLVNKTNLLENVVNQQTFVIQQLGQKYSQDSLRTQLQFYPNTEVSTNKKQQDQEAVVPLEYLRKHQDVISSLAESVQKLQQQLSDSEKKPKIKLEFDNIQESIQKPKIQFETDEHGNPSEHMAEQLIPEASTPQSFYKSKEIQQIPLLIKQSSPYALPSMSLPNTYEIERTKQTYQKKLSIIHDQNKELMRQHDNELLKLQKERADPRKKSQTSLHSISNEKKSKQTSLHSQSNEELDRMISPVGIRGLMKKDRRTPSPLMINDSKISSSMRDSKLSNASSKNLKSSHQLIDKKKEKLKPIQAPQKQSLKQGPTPVSRGSRLQQVSKQEEDDEVVYQLDEDGYLMNEKGEYLLDGEGNFIQITSDQLEELRAQNLIEEEY